MSTLYYQTPFDEPMIGRKAISQYWNKGAQTLRDMWWHIREAESNPSVDAG